MICNLTNNWHLSFSRSGGVGCNSGIFVDVDSEMRVGYLSLLLHDEREYLWDQWHKFH